MGCRGLTPVSPFPVNLQEEGSWTQNLRGLAEPPCAGPPRGTRESRLWPGTPGARRLLDPSKQETSTALGFGEEGDPRAGTMDGDRSSLRVSEDGITQQPHAFHLELIGKPC